MSAGWLYLLAAGLAEVAFALCLKQAAGFTRLWPSLGLVVAGLVGLFFLMMALRTVPLGVGYAVWTAIGIVGAVLAGTFLLGERIETGHLLGVSLVLAGVVTLQVATA